MAELNCVIVGQKGRGGSTYNEKDTYMGYVNGTAHDYVLSFTTGDFSGKCTAVNFNLRCANTSYSADTTRTYRWALLSSDANALGTTSLYYKLSGLPADVTTDPYQIARGTVDFYKLGQYSLKTLTVEVDSLKPNTGYFLVLWPAATNSIQITMSAISSHVVSVEYDPRFTVELNHCLMDAAGALTWYSRTTAEVEPGASYTPTLITPPSTHTQRGATFKAWVIGWTSVVGEGVVGEDYITVNEDLTLEVYYHPAGSFVYVNRNGEAVRCEVYVNRNGKAVRCDVYVNKNGTAVKI